MKVYASMPSLSITTTLHDKVLLILLLNAKDGTFLRQDY